MLPAGSRPPQARRPRADRRGDRLLRRRADRRDDHRGPGRRLRDGGLLPGDDPRRARGLHPGDARFRHGPGLVRRGPPGTGARQALHRRRRRQGLAHAGPDRGGLRRRRADDLRARPRPLRRHARQDGRDRRLHDGARQRPLPSGRARGRLRDHRPDRRPRPGGPAALRHPRRDRDGGEHPPDHVVDPVEEAGRGPRRPRAGRDVRHRRLHERPTRTPGRWPRASWRSRTEPAAARRRS